MKKDIWKRLLSFAPALVLMVGMVPQTVLMAHAEGEAAQITAGTELTTYTITVAETANGTIGVNRAAAAVEAAVNLRTPPAAGYVQETLGVRTGSGTSVEIVNGSFTMPNENVTITVSFRYVEPCMVYFDNSVQRAVANTIALLSVVFYTAGKRTSGGE